MILPRLSPEEIRALQINHADAACKLSDRIKAQLKAALPPQVRVEASPLDLAEWAFDGEPPVLRADNDLLAAWVAARFGSTGVSKPVPARYGASLLARVGQAVAQCVLRGQMDEMTSLQLDIRLNDQHGRLLLDWRGISAQALSAWAVKQWESTHG